MIARFAALVLAAALLAPLPALAQRTITKLEVRTQDPRRTDAALKEQLWGIFEHEDRRRERRPQRPLNDVWLDTRPYSTEVPGLCRRDLLTLRLAPLERERHPTARTPTRAYGVDLSSHFHFLSPPADWHEVVADHERLPWEPRCARLKRDKVQFFHAPDNEVATNGYRAMLVARKAVAGGEIGLGDCKPYGAESRSCAALLAAWSDAPDFIETCAAPVGQECYEISAGDERLRVLLVGRYNSSKKARRGQLISVSLDFLIILAHERID